MGKKRKKRLFCILFSLAAAVYLCFTLHPERSLLRVRSEKIAVQKNKERGFTPFQLTGAPGLGGGLFNPGTPVYGVSVGGMVHQKEISGLSVAGIHAFTEKKSGLSVSFMDICNESRGFSICAGGGAVRNYGVATGLWNLAEHNSGLQLGVVNQVKNNAVLTEYPADGQRPEGFGVQAGVFNYSEGRGIQLGLWNTNPHALIKHFPLINFAF